jgi:hypothetical protein
VEAQREGTERPDRLLFSDGPPPLGAHRSMNAGGHAGACGGTGVSEDSPGLDRIAKTEVEAREMVIDFRRLHDSPYD